MYVSNQTRRRAARTSASMAANSGGDSTKIVSSWPATETHGGAGAGAGSRTAAAVASIGGLLLVLVPPSLGDPLPLKQPMPGRAMPPAAARLYAGSPGTSAARR